MKSIYRTIFAVAISAFTALVLFAPYTERGNEALAQTKKTLYYFYGKNCPHCAQAEPIVDRLGRQYRLAVKKYEVWYDVNNRNMLVKMGKERGKNVQGVPTVIMGRDVYTGSSAEKLEQLVKKNMK